MAHPITTSLLHPLFVNAFPRFRLLFGNHGGSHVRKTRLEFAVIIPNQIAWFFSIRSRFSQLLRHPGIGGGSGHIHVDDLPRFQVDDEESKKRAEEKVWDVEKIAGPDLCGM